MLFEKSQFQGDSGSTNKKLPTKNDDESSLVDYTIEISNLELVKDLVEVVDLLINS
ncbi:MAG: hypothetical protein U9N53_09150 [Bacteroidota bacterium]|nr:hypothetical protein [Bacteroidota bacterium]